MELAVFNTSGEEVRKIEVSDDVFNAPRRGDLLHQALTRQLANARQGTADTKTRGEVAGSTSKLFRQKGTGRARQGGSRAPHRRHGGIVFGPHPRDYRQDMPKKMRRLAILSALSSKVADEELMVVEALDLPDPSTKRMTEIIKNMRLGHSVLIVTENSNENVVRSARNIPRIWTSPASVLNVGDILKYRRVLMTEGAIRRVEELWGAKTASRSDAT